MASQLEPSFSSASPHSTMTRGLGQTLCSKGERNADAHREPVPERSRGRLDAGHQHAIGVRAQRVAPPEKATEPVPRKEPLLREDRVEGDRSVALAEDEAIAPFPSRVRRIHAQHAVVEHHQRIERGCAALLVLLVAGGERHQAANVGERLAAHIYRHLAI
jgi:hypothetical protein